MFIVEYASHESVPSWHKEGHYREFRYADMIADWMSENGFDVRLRETTKSGRTLNIAEYQVLSEPAWRHEHREFLERNVRPFLDSHMPIQ